MPKRNPSTPSNTQQFWADLPLSESEYQNDASNAERFVRLNEGIVRYCAKLREWFVWEGKHWVRDARTLVMRLAKETGRAMLIDGRSQESALKFAKASNNRQGLENMLALAEVDKRIAIEPNELDQEPMLLNCNNGTLDLRTMQLLPHDPKRLLTKLCPVDFIPEAMSAEWDRFLASILPDPEHRQFLQRWFGYCLTGETREQILLFFVGGGANGKSTLLDVIQHVLGEDFAIQGSPDLLVDKPRDSHPTNRMDLFCRRLVVCTETEIDQKLAESQLKQLTGSDRIVGRRMRQDNWQFRPTHKLILCTNHMPKLSGGDDALWRRIIVVLFAVRFWNPATDAHGPELLRQDKHLPQKLKAESPAILAWMVAGCRDWQANGEISVPDSLRRLTDEYRHKVDVVRQFVDECCETGNSSFRLAADDLQTSLRQFCEDRKETILSPQKVADRMKQLGYTVMKSGKRFYCGLRLKSHDPTPPKKIIPRTLPRR